MRVTGDSGFCVAIRPRAFHRGRLSAPVPPAEAARLGFRRSFRGCGFGCGNCRFWRRSRGRCRCRCRLHIAHGAGGKHRRRLAYRRAAAWRFCRRRPLCGSSGLGLACHRLERPGRWLSRLDGCFRLARPAEIGDRIRDFWFDTVLLARLIVMFAISVLGRIAVLALAAAPVATSAATATAPPAGVAIAILAAMFAACFGRFAARMGRGTVITLVHNPILGSALLRGLALALTTPATAAAAPAPAARFALVDFVLLGFALCVRRLLLRPLDLAFGFRLGL